jgi:hypothetical protein
VFSIHAKAQSTAELPHEEYRPYFKLAPYHRGFDKDSLGKVMEYLIEKPRKKWTKNDSIAYVMSLCNAGEYDLAFTVFDRLKLSRLHTQEEYHIVQHMLLFKARFFALEDCIDNETSDFPDFKNTNDVRKRINHVNRLYHRKEWDIQDSVIFPELLDKKWKNMARGSDEYIKTLIPLVMQYDLALRIEVQFESLRNPALSESFLEFGDFLYQHVSLSDAYVAYSISRYYNKINNKAALKIKALKAEMNRKNILFPSLRKIFPKQDKGIFNYKNILEKRQKQLDSVDEQNSPNLMIEAEEPKYRWFTDKLEDIMKLAGILIILLVVAIFVRTK